MLRDAGLQTYMRHPLLTPRGLQFTFNYSLDGFILTLGHMCCPASVKLTCRLYLLRWSQRTEGILLMCFPGCFFRLVACCSVLCDVAITHI